MEKVDFKKTLKSLFNPPVNEFVEIEIPQMQFVKVDGAGDPNTAFAYRSAIEWLYGISYAMKFASKGTLGKKTQELHHSRQGSVALDHDDTCA